MTQKDMHAWILQMRPKHPTWTYVYIPQAAVRVGANIRAGAKPRVGATISVRVRVRVRVRAGCQASDVDVRVHPAGGGQDGRLHGRWSGLRGADALL